MSQAIRTVGVGLLGAGWLATHLQAEFVSLVGDGSSPIIREMTALQADSPLAAHIVGVGAYLPAIFILGCIGVGLFAAGAVYPLIENALPLERIGKFLSKPVPVTSRSSENTHVLEKSAN